MKESFDETKYYLGKLCKREHGWNDTGRSLRNIKGRYCLQCHRDLNKTYFKTEEGKKRKHYYNTCPQRKKWKKKYREQLRQQERYRLNDNISRAIRYILKEGGSHTAWEKHLGYMIKTQLKNRLISTLPNGYCWQDYLDGKLQLDHIIGIVNFNFSKPEHNDFKKCWALNNLRLLPSSINMSKPNKIKKPFQPSLKI